MRIYFIVFDLVFSTKPRDWLGRTSPKFLFCVGFDVKPSLSQSINLELFAVGLGNLDNYSGRFMCQMPCHPITCDRAVLKLKALTPLTVVPYPSTNF